jgi:hypothetical protein
MDTVIVELDYETAIRARRLARARGTTITALLQHLISELDHTASPDAILGLFADEPTLMDAVVVDAMHSRELHLLRATDG